MSSPNRNQIRIIGGQWRGRKITFPPLPFLRPTPDRVKETLFNWLSSHIVGANCLDLFAGSGGLGLEALSRGAGEVTFVDNQLQAIQHIRETASRLDINHAHFMHGTVPSLKLNALKSFDVVFLDPPYAQNLIEISANWLEHHHYLSEKAYIYIECGVDDALHNLPKNWHIRKDKLAGQVRYLLIERSP